MVEVLKLDYKKIQIYTESSTLYVDRTSISGMTVSSSDVVLSSTITTLDAIMLLL